MRSPLSLSPLRFLIVASLLWLGAQARGQSEAVGLPSPVGQFWRTGALFNPASLASEAAPLDSEGGATVYGGHRRFLSGWGALYSTYAHAAYAPSGEGHAFGATFFGEQEGPYLNRSRAYGLYAYRLRLGARWRLAAGGAFGIASYQISSTPVSAGGAATAPDGDAGVYADDGHWRLGLSAKQLFNSALRPVGETLRLAPVYVASAERTVVLGPFVEARAFAMARYPELPRPFEPRLEIDGALTVTVSESIALTAAYRHERSATGAFLLRKIALPPGELSFGLSYATPISDRPTELTTYELFLRFDLSR